MNPHPESTEFLTDADAMLEPAATHEAPIGGERHERQLLGERALELMQRVASETNTAIGKKMLDSQGRIKMSMFTDVFGAEKVQADRAAAETRQAEWLGLDDDAVRNFHLNRLGLAIAASQATPEQVTDMLRQRIELEQQSKDGPLGEMMATMVLHRGLHEKFFVVRSAVHDDQEHGVDNLIINRATGEIVCGFDEVVGSADDPRVREKQRKELKAIEHGGARVDYGFTVEQGRVVKRSFHHLPVFTFRLQHDEIDTLLGEAEHGQALGRQSMEVLRHFINDMTTQLDHYLNDSRVGPEMKSRLTQYRDGSLAEMRAMIVGAAA